VAPGGGTAGAASSPAAGRPPPLAPAPLAPLVDPWLRRGGDLGPADLARFLGF